MASNRSLGTLTLDLIAKLGGFTGPLDQAGRQASKVSNQIGRDFAKMGAAIAASATAAVGAMGLIVRSNVEMMDSLSKMSRQIGISTEGLSGMRYAADQMAGVSAGNLDMALRRMTRRIAEAAQGGGPAAKALNELGLSIENLNQMSPDEQFLALADAIQGTSNQSDRLRHVMALMDTEGMPLVNMLAEGADAIREYNKEAESLGLIVREEDARRAEEFTNAMGALRGALRGIGMQVTSELLPQLQNLVETFIRLNNENDGLETVIRAVGTAFSFAAEGVRLMAENLPQVVTALSSFMAVKVVSVINNRVRAIMGAIAADKAHAAQALQTAQAIATKTAQQLADARASLAAATTDKQREAAQRTLTQAVTAHTAAQTRLAAASAAAARGVGIFAGAARGLLGLFGGPAGLLFIVGTTAASFLTFRDNANQAQGSLSDFSGTLDEAIEKFRELNTQQQNFEILSLTREIEEGAKSITSSIGSIGRDLLTSNSASLEQVNQLNYGLRALERQFDEGKISADQFSAGVAFLLEEFEKSARLTDQNKEALIEHQAAIANSAREVDRKRGILGEFSAAQNTAATAVTETNQALSEQERLATLAGNSLGQYIQQTTAAVARARQEIVRLRGGVEAEQAYLLSQAAAGVEGPTDPTQVSEAVRANQELLTVTNELEAAREWSRNQATRDRGASSTRAAGMSEEQRALEQLQQRYNGLIETLDRRIALAGDSSELAALNYDLERGALSGLSEDLKEVLRLRTAEALAVEEAAEARKRAAEEAEAQERRAIEIQREKLESQAREMEEANRRYREYLGNIRHEAALLGLSADAQERLDALRMLGLEVGSKSAQALVEALELYQEQRKAVENQVRAMDQLRNSASGFLSEIVRGSKSLKDAFLDALDSINNRLVNMISNNLTEALLGDFGSADSSASGAGGFFSRMFGGLFGVKPQDEFMSSLPEGVDPFAEGAIQAIRDESQRMADGVIQSVDLAMQTVSMSVQSTTSATAIGVEAMAGTTRDVGEDATGAIANAMTGSGGFFSTLSQLMSAVGSMLGGGGTGGFISSIFSAFGGGRAFGGSVDPFGLYRVNEIGPELLSIGQQDYLMMGSKGGSVTPNNKLAGGGVTQVNNFQIHGRMDRRTEGQIAASVGERTNRAVRRTV